MSKSYCCSKAAFGLLRLFGLTAEASVVLVAAAVAAAAVASDVGAGATVAASLRFCALLLAHTATAMHSAQHTLPIEAPMITAGLVTMAHSQALRDHFTVTMAI